MKLNCWNSWINVTIERMEAKRVEASIKRWVGREGERERKRGKPLFIIFTHPRISPGYAHGGDFKANIQELHAGVAKYKLINDSSHPTPSDRVRREMRFGKCKFEFT
jgi:hypothetical protein